MNKNTPTRKIGNRRGISTVVGALFFTVLMIAGFSALSLALDAQTDIVNTQRMISETELKKQQERFSIGATTDENNNLGIFVNNHGQNPVEITSIWIINKTLSEQPAKRFTIPPDTAYVPSGTGSEILSTMPLTINPDTYDIKVVSTYGTIEEDEIVVNGGSGGSSNILRSQLFTIPPDVIAGQNVTIAMLVTNTGGFPLESVSPAANPPYTSKPSNLIASEMTSFGTVNLAPLETVLFKWNAEVSGPLGSTMDFSTYAKGIEPDSGKIYKSANSTDTITFQIDGGDDGTLIALSKDLLNRPEIFAILPSPLGGKVQAGNDASLWGINVVNPVNATMEVSKLVITAFASGANDNVEVINNSCTIQSISPSGEWSCPSQNAIMWQNRTHPIILEPYSTQSFMAKVEPAQTGKSHPIESVAVQASVFTTMGSFGKTAYQSTYHEGGASFASIYLSTTVDSVDPQDFRGNSVNIGPGDVEVFNVVLADLDTQDSTEIKAGAKLIINVPREWDDVTVISHPGFIASPSVTLFGDGSSQIIGEIVDSIGGINGNQADTITFSARSPSVSSDQMYVMHILADGETNNGISVGPLAEILLQVESPLTP